jgi:UDP-N-acetylmuramate--alanine ligase
MGLCYYVAMVNFSTVKSVHLIGIGGVGISSLGHWFVHLGKKVSGTNDVDSPKTLSGLSEKGVNVTYDLTPSSLPQAEVYVYSDAWLKKHQEILAEAKSRGVPTISYFEALGLLASQYKVAAIAGTHGKTTTTAMCADVAEAADLSPTVVVGSLRNKTGSNFAAGDSEWLIVEADEYMRHFLNFEPTILAIINIDCDHMEYYKDLSDIQSAFRTLIGKVKPSGKIVADLSQPNVANVLADMEVEVIDVAAKKSVVHN